MKYLIDIKINTEIISSKGKKREDYLSEENKIIIRNYISK